MKEYIKPSILEEEIELEDVIAVSKNDGTGNVDDDGVQKGVSDLWS